MRLSEVGFSPDRVGVRKMAFQFAESLGINHPFNKEEKVAGWAWFYSFLRRNPHLSIRKGEGLSVARALGVGREIVNGYFEILRAELSRYEVMNKPQNIWNIDETGIQLINKVGQVITRKGAKNVPVITGAEKGETISLIGCCNAEGNFLPPTLILKGVKRKPEFSVGLPPGSNVYMNPKSAYINEQLFLKWFNEEFIPRKAPGRNILILDGHASHTNCLKLLETAENNDISLICLPSHCTHALQPLDVSIYGPLKINFRKLAQYWQNNNANRKITRYEAGKLIGDAWMKTALPVSAINGFQKTGIYPFNPSIIPEYYFQISDYAAIRERETQQLIESENNNLICSESVQPIPSTSKDFQLPSTSSNNFQPTTINNSRSDESILPCPLPVLNTKPRRKQSAKVLTSAENISLQKEKDQKKTQVKDKCKPQKGRKRKIHMKVVEVQSISSPAEEIDTNNCVECWENYYTTKSKADWIICPECRKWLHETCTLYNTMCNECGRKKKRMLNLEKQK